MYLKGIILSLALLSCIAGGRSEPQCVFTIPALLKSEETAQGCLEVKRHSEPVKVNVILEVSGVNHTIVDKEIPAKDTFECMDFQVPSLTKAAPVFLTVSALASNYNYTARRAVVVAPTGKVTLMQLERSLFKSGQKVQFNVIALDNNLKPVEDKYRAIYVTDPSGNRLHQWNDQETQNGLLALSFPILEDPDYGTYQIVVETESGRSVSKPVTVDEFVLPTFGLELQVPTAITILDKAFSYSAISKYTYGLGVPGKVSGRVCRPLQYYNPRDPCKRNPDGLCVPITGVLDSAGTFSGELDLGPFQLDRPGFSMSLNMDLTVTEDGSGVQVLESKYISIRSELGRVYFNSQNMDPYYKPGIPYYIEVTAEDGRQKPLSDHVMELQVNGETIKNVTTDANGKVKDYIDTSELDDSSISVQVIYQNEEQCYDSNFIAPTYQNAQYTATRAYSRSGSFVHIDGPKEELQCGQKYTLKGNFIFSQSGLQEGETTANFAYMVLSKTKILNSGTIPADLSKSLKGEFTIDVEITPDHAPGSDVIVYYLMEKEVVASTIRLNTEKCFKHQVSLQFSEERATPGSTVNLDIKSAPRSLCATRLFDSSLLLLQQDQPLTPESVYSSLQFTSLSGYFVGGYDVTPPREPCIDANKPFIKDGLYWYPSAPQNEEDTYDLMNNVGVLFITNTTTQRPSLCGGRVIAPQPVFFDNFASGGWSSSSVARPMLTATAFAEVSPDPAPGVTTVTTVRNSFPVVWFFGQTQISESGSTSVPLTVPGTITQWIGDTVCLDPETGFGMTKEQANLTSYQDFFVIDSLPYSIVRGEILTARIIVSSTLSTCAQVRASIKPSDDFTVEAIDGDKNQCICSGQRATFSFNLNAKSVGVVSVSITGEAYSTGSSCEASPASDVPNYKDTIERTFIVEPEGIPTEVTRSTLTCVKDEEVVLPIETSPAPNSLEDTVKRRVVFIGEIVGRAFVNPESMIKDPTGCGEQNLATLMPIALVLDYMNLTGRLTGEIKSRAVQFMANGYIRQIRFRNSDGSFSTFPRQEGNSWLTLQTLATLERIKKYTMVEDKVPNQALVYLERLKDPNTGAFKPRGPMYNNALKGAAEDDVTFTALLAAYLLESSYAASPTLVREALAFLVAASQKDQSVYNTALLFYVFRVAGNMERSGAMLNKLKGMQKEEEGGVFWERTNKPNNPQSYVFSSQAASAEIQITSYVLKGLTVGPSPTPADLGLMSQIALWISRQQNALGSYSTTADSMVALDAICSYGFLVYQKDATNVIRVKNGGETVAEFNLDSEKRNFLQSQPLPNTPGDYSVSISGNGCVLTQSVVNSNIPVNEDDSAFLLTVDTPSESCVDGVAYTFPVALNVSYKGQRNESNMAIVDVALPSGYTLEYQSLMELRRKVAKVEQKNNHIIIYLEKVSSEVISLNMTFKMNTRVQNMQQRYVLGWDYYDKGDNGIAVIRHPCSSQ